MSDTNLSPLETEVLAFFSDEGILAQHQPGYRVRTGQLTMAQAVARAINQGEGLVVEAGTGVGKTYAYLAPALLSGRRVMVSTATKALQDQLFTRDLPAVSEAIGLPVRAALLKGRSSYLCLHRMEQAWHRSPAGDRYIAHLLRKVEIWSASTRTGDLAEIPGLDERSEVHALVTSTRDNCLGSQCPQFRACHVNAARREALAADLVVVNHHLFFADWAVRESGMAELLPTVDVVVFDEAHQLNEIGVQFLGVSVGSAEILDWGRDVLAHGLQSARGLRDWAQVTATLEKVVQDLRLCLQPGGRRSGGAISKIRWSEGDVPQGVDAATWSTRIEILRQAISDVCASLESVQEAAPDFQRLLERGRTLDERLWKILQPDQPDCARWLELGTQFRLVLAPLDVAQAFGHQVMGRIDEDVRKTWLFTSATLGADDKLSWFTGPLGLDGVTTLRVSSPFDYPQQAGLYVPWDLPGPSDPEHPEAVARAVWPWAEQLGGRTLILTTTLRALKAIARQLTQLSQIQGDFAPEVLVQGAASKRELLDRFRRSGQAGGPGAVLVASASFWEGVDLPGECLQLVVIDKLPFPPPDDPWVEARSRALQAAGLSPFKAFSLPEATVALKQGAGRLIRSENDQGVLVICDRRLRSMGYGRQLLDCLPPMQRLESESAMTERLTAIVTTVSTMDLPWV